MVDSEQTWKKLSLRGPKNCTRRGSSFGQWAPAVEGFPEEQPSDGGDPPAAAADEDGEEEEEEKELALLSPPPDEVDELEVEMELMEESMELPKDFMGEPMEETPNEPGTSSTAAPKAAPPPKVDKKTALLQKLVGLRLAYGHKPPPGM